MYMTLLEGKDFDENGNMEMEIPKGFYTPLDGQREVFHLERFPIITPRGDFDCLSMSLFSAESGDLATQAVFQQVAQLIGELSYASTKGVNNAVFMTLSSALLDYFAHSPEQVASIDKLLTGDVRKMVTPKMRIRLPEGVDQFGGRVDAVGIMRNEFNLGIASCSVSRNNTPFLINSLFDASGLFLDQPKSILRQMAQDITKAKLAMAFGS